MSCQGFWQEQLETAMIKSGELQARFSVNYFLSYIFLIEDFVSVHTIIQNFCKTFCNKIVN